VSAPAVLPAYAKSRGRRFDDYCELMHASSDEPLPFTYSQPEYNTRLTLTPDIWVPRQLLYHPPTQHTSLSDGRKNGNL